jgi:hypothetical protein
MSACHSCWHRMGEWMPVSTRLTYYADGGLASRGRVGRPLTTAKQRAASRLPARRHASKSPSRWRNHRRVWPTHLSERIGSWPLFSLVTRTTPPKTSRVCCADEVSTTVSPRSSGAVAKPISTSTAGAQDRSCSGSHATRGRSNATQMTAPSRSRHTSSDKRLAALSRRRRRRPRS